MTSPATDDRFRPLPLRRRLLIVGLALTTAMGIVLAIVYQPGLKLVRKLPDDVAACRDGRSTGCVGGQIDVIALPPAASGAASR